MKNLNRVGVCEVGGGGGAGVKKKPHYF